MNLTTTITKNNDLQTGDFQTMFSIIFKSSKSSLVKQFPVAYSVNCFVQVIRTIFNINIFFI